MNSLAGDVSEMVSICVRIGYYQEYFQIPDTLSQEANTYPEKQQKINLTKGKTSIYISHRLASTRFCDRIVLIDNKTIAESGSHEELMKIGGKYAKMFEIQSQYYKEENHEAEK